jgi:DNA invertase Pin-like site-specific DNA recombinase
MLVGYVRVSTQEQDLALQLNALRAAGCEKVYREKASSAQRERPALHAALAYMRQGATRVIRERTLTDLQTSRARGP